MRRGFVDLLSSWLTDVSPLVSRRFSPFNPIKSLAKYLKTYIPKIQAIAVFKAHYSTPIDMFGSFETATLHELGHTRAGGSLIDVRPAPGLSIVGFYGWSHVRSLGARAWTSSEANAYHGLIGFIIDKRGLIPLANGQLVRIA